MHVRTLRYSQLLPVPRADVFPFFAAAENLERLTPPWLHFRILTPTPFAMRRGALIDYRIRLHGLPLRWRTEIAEWEPPFRFVDTQLRGPYRLWVHTHTFTDVPGGTRCDDEIRYAVPGGRLVDTLFVRSQVERIFAYRQGVLNELFCRPPRITGAEHPRAAGAPAAATFP
jgi:ligand-binding SRPBCC domain-containing protein